MDLDSAFAKGGLRFGLGLLPAPGLLFLIRKVSGPRRIDFLLQHPPVLTR